MIVTTIEAGGASYAPSRNLGRE